MPGVPFLCALVQLRFPATPDPSAGLRPGFYRYPQPGREMEAGRFPCGDDGFSAGGHLALSETIFYQENFATCPGIKPELGRADALMLCYPVISSGEFAHRGSFNALLGEKPDPTLVESLSLAIPETSDGDSGNINLHAAQWFRLCLNWVKLQFGMNN
jgi:hypothetical protein